MSDVSLRERLESWPSIRVQLELCPWHWEFRWYRDDVHPWTFFLTLGPLKVEVWI